MESVTVNILSYRYGHLVAHCVDSVLSQTVKANVVRVFDDGVGDCRHLSRLYGIEVIERPTNLGVVENINDALMRTETDRCMMLGGDNWLRPDALETLLHYSEDIVSYDLILAGTEMDEFGEYVSAHFRWCGHRIWQFHPCDIEQGNWIHGSSLFRTGLGKQIGYRSSSDPTHPEEDWMLWKGMLAAGASHRHLSEGLMFYRRHRENFLKWPGQGASRERPLFASLAGTAFPVVFYHIAAIGNWREVVADQLHLLASCGLGQSPVKVTFVGDPSDIAFVEDEAARHGVKIEVLRKDPNVMQYETFAMLEIEKWVTHNETGVLYLHTKGVSEPGHEGKRRWRQLMENELVRKWRQHLSMLDDFDLIGVNWRQMPPISHFAGNFWLARADYLRKLESFVLYHHRNGLARTNCEFWIGSAPEAPRILSLVNINTEYCVPEHFG